MKRILPILLSLGLFCAHPATAQDGQQTEGANFWQRLQVKARVGYSIGGTAPIGIPATIRSIESFRLTPNFMVGADGQYQFTERFGLLAGLHYEIKDMNAEVTTKGYHMKVQMDDDELEGVYTGHVGQKVRQRMFTVPVLLTYALSRTVQLKAGPYLSLLVSKSFYGHASDGYLRKDNPTGTKVVMGDKEGEWATYDFSGDMCRCQMGLTVGIDWDFYRRLGLSADLNWGLTGIHRSDFKTVEQTLYPIYGTIGLFYKIK